MLIGLYCTKELPKYVRQPQGGNMANKDLRDWIDGVRAAGELKVIKGGEPKEEVGGIVDIYQRRMGIPAAMSDEVPGCTTGPRVIAHLVTAVPRNHVPLGLPPTGIAMELDQSR